MAAGMAKVAWVTGGSAGIGLAIARALAEAGYRVVISARNEARLCEACVSIPGSEGIVADVTDRAAIGSAAQSILDRHGRIDVLVSNAGFNVRRRTWDDLVPEEFDAVIAANLTGAFNAVHAVLPAMRAQRSGHIVAISSVAGKQISLEGGVAYTVAKHGVHIMSRLLQQSEHKHGIKVSVISPGGVSTRAHDWRPQEVRAFMLPPEEVARAVRFITDSPPNTAIFDIELSWAPA